MGAKENWLSSSWENFPNARFKILLNRNKFKILGVIFVLFEVQGEFSKTADFLN